MGILSRILPTHRIVSQIRHDAFCDVLINTRQNLVELIRLGVYSSRYESCIIDRSEHYELTQELEFLDKMLNKYVYKE